MCDATVQHFCLGAENEVPEAVFSLLSWKGCQNAKMPNAKCQMPNAKVITVRRRKSRLPLHDNAFVPTGCPTSLPAAATSARRLLAHPVALIPCESLSTFGAKWFELYIQDVVGSGLRQHVKEKRRGEGEKDRVSTKSFFGGGGAE